MQRLRSLLRGSALLHRFRFLHYVVLYSLGVRLRSVRAGRVLFLSDAREDFSGNFAFLRDEIATQDPTADIIGIFKPSLASRRSLLDTWRLPFLMATAQAIVLDDFYPIVYPLTIRPETRLIQVWHAAGAFKKVGWSRAGLPGGPEAASLAHKNYTDAIVSAEGVRPDYAEAFGIDIERVHALGVARSDAFFDDDAVARAHRDIRSRYALSPATKIALFAPTFRGNGQRSATYDTTLVDWERLLAELPRDWTVLVKMHPFVPPVPLPRNPRLIDVSPDREMTELLMAADVLVTDYSSAIFEYALLNRPIVMFCPDLEEYTGSRDFYRPFDRYITGPLLRDDSALATAILSAQPGDHAAAFREEFLAACDGSASRRIVRDVILTPRATVKRSTVAPGSGPEPTRVEGRMAIRVLAAHATRVILSLLYGVAKMFPLQRKIVMLSREHDRVPQDFVDLAEAVKRADPGVRVVTLVRMVPPGIAGKLRYGLHLLRQIVEVATARVLVVDTYSIVASVLTHRRELTVVQIWHALGAFKKFGLSILGEQEGRDPRLASAMRMHHGYDVVLTSSEGCRAAYAEAFGTEPSHVVVAPLPRVDHLRNLDERERTRERVFAAHPHLRGKTIAVYAPTFRLDAAVSVDVAGVTESLAHIAVHTVVKLHPLMQGTFPSIVDTTEGFSTQEMLSVADLFITDYSSALYEAAIVGVPSYFLAPDIDEYLKARDFYLDYRKDLPGPIVSSVAELTEAVRSRRASPHEALAFAERWVTVPPGGGPHACADHIVAVILASLTEHPRAHEREI